MAVRRPHNTVAMTALAMLAGIATALLALSLYDYQQQRQQTRVSLSGVPIPLSTGLEIQRLAAAMPLMNVKKGKCTDYLDRGLGSLVDQTVGCPKHSAIVDFGWLNCTDPNRTDFRAKYTCLESGSNIKEGTPSHSTSCAVGREGTIDAFTGHEVQCPDGQVLRSWHLKPCGKHHVQTDFWCSDATMGPPETVYGECEPLVGKTLDNLDGVQGGCSSSMGSAMTGFELEADGCEEGSLRFRYTCARVGMPGKCRDGSGCDLYNIESYGYPTPFHASGYWDPKPFYPDGSFYKEFYEQD
eukprot:CAMPEP_0181301770 /NCGR_PEP_ID=MMETSP1101-20121128/7607_1 /TAXON_ID=46948 /ORGANISM="Rhodomonas abbreviata, Strain Caron Lab Isolate" /LENGTH=297 /DNA_ID=CAMNT_0023407109 /DNA_START=4 /DNA_END=897 /DNA_ORIENTATION=-